MATAKKATKKTTSKKTTTKAPAKAKTNTPKTVAKSTAKVETTKSTKVVNSASSKKNCAPIVAIIAVILILIGAIVAITVAILNKTSDMIGTYTLTGLETDGKDNSETIDLIKSFGLTASIEITDKDNGELNLFGEKVEFAYDKNYIIIDDDGKEEKTEYSYKDGELTFEKEGSKLTFTKENK